MATTAGPFEGPRSLGQHLASRLTQIGVSEFMGVPGDYNLTVRGRIQGAAGGGGVCGRRPLLPTQLGTGSQLPPDWFCAPGSALQLLDELEKDTGLRGMWCCNELNAGAPRRGGKRRGGGRSWRPPGPASYLQSRQADCRHLLSAATATYRCPRVAGYAADGYARVKGVGCAVVTFTVGGLSIINAIAGKNVASTSITPAACRLLPLPLLLPGQRCPLASRQQQRRHLLCAAERRGPCRHTPSERLPASLPVRVQARMPRTCQLLSSWEAPTQTTMHPITSSTTRWVGAGGRAARAGGGGCVWGGVGWLDELALGQCMLW